MFGRPSKGQFTRSNFWSQLSLKFEEVSDANQHLYEVRNNAKKIIGSEK